MREESVYDEHGMATKARKADELALDPLLAPCRPAASGRHHFRAQVS
jgi:hypothetical protein